MYREGLEAFHKAYPFLVSFVILKVSFETRSNFASREL